MKPDTVTLEEAVALLSLPRVVGVDPEGREVTALNGRYGPYLTKAAADGEKPDSRSLDREEQLFTVTLEEAEALFAQPKRRRGRTAKPPIAELGPHPDSGAAVRVLDGRFGPYVTDGSINATVPRGVQPEEIDLDQAVELLAERAARGPAKKATRKSTKKKAPPKTTTRVVKKGTSKRAKAAKRKRS
jgi:DNA topoisomerase-1